MKKLEESVSEPWIVHVYGQNRKLLWVLEPSHGWVFLLGCLFGLLLAITHFNLVRYMPTAESQPPSDYEGEMPALQLH